MKKFLNCVRMVGLVLAGMGAFHSDVHAAEETVRTVKPIWGAEDARTPPSGKPIRSRKSEEAVDLGSLSNESSKPMSGASSASGNSFHSGSSGVLPNFKFYFDFLYKYRPMKQPAGSTVGPVGDHGFDSFHQVFMVEITPTPELSFMADLGGLRYYESDYKTSDRLTLRWGKIWIPFDDMTPHNIYGGRINTSKFFEGFGTTQAFLPDIWADLGLGLKYIFVDTTALAAEGHLYVVNGFQGGATEPAGSGADYPNFSGTGIAVTDNNSGKAIGGRAHLKFFQRFGVGASFYRGAYTAKDTPNQSISMYGFDSQLRPTASTELRAGIVYAQVGLNPPATKSSFSRGGMYAEFGQKFGTDLKWKFLGRAGMVQNDNRVIAVTDQKLLGVTLLRNLGAVEVSLYYSRDFEKVVAKPSYNFGALRVVTAF